ncbi:hypothetical protein NVP1257O_19 [Vibrio phage 1.257.O._10N.286.46.A4]|nr:hypothetical protein NVP1257O_19 [Vibrio phage 1.257.O._10N.286.46.A4]
MTKKFGTNVYAPVVAGDDTEDDAVAAYGDELGRTIHHFDTEKEKDTFTGKFKSRLYKSWCVVKDSSAWYEWTGVQEDGTDGAWSELDLGSPSSAGVTLKGAGKQAAGVTEITVAEGLELVPDKDDSTKAIVRIAPQVFGQGTPSAYLAGMTKDKIITAADSDAIVFYDMSMTEAGTGIEVDVDKYGIQDPTFDDPNVTGGTPTEVLATIGFNGSAPEDGRITFSVKLKQAGQVEAYLKNPNGKVVVYARDVKQGQELKPMFLAGLVQAKGIEYIRFHVSHTFKNSDLVIDHTQAFMCFQQLTGSWRTSVARNTFEQKAGITFTPMIEHFGENILSADHEFKNDIALRGLNSYSGWDDLDIIGLRNLTKVQAGVDGGKLIVKNDGVSVTDFMVDMAADHHKTRMLRGHNVRFDFELVDKNNGWNLGLFAWTGEADKFGDLYSTRTNGAINLNANFTQITNTFISEDAISGVHKVSVSGVVPDSANNVIAFLYPIQAQAPITLQIQSASMSTAPFTAYMETSPILASELHLHFSEAYTRFVQNTQGYASLRYTYNAAEQPAPTGIQFKGKAPITIDTAANQVGGSQARGGEGAYKFNFAGTVSISVSASASNETGNDSTMALFFRKVNPDNTLGDEIPGSRVTWTIKAGDKNVEHGLPAFLLDVVTGDRIAPRVLESAVDGGYLECDNDRQPLIETIFDIKKLTP